MGVKGQRVESDIDLFSAEQGIDPYPALDKLREQGPAVYMTCHDFWLLSRYDDVRAATADWQSYTSAQGVALLPFFNEILAGTVLGSDPPKHDELRAVLSERLAPRALIDLRDKIATQADESVSRLVERGTFDAVTDLARVFPIEVVADLVGLPKEGRERLHPGADAIFTAFGPMTPVLEERIPAVMAYQEYMESVTSRDQLTPGSWGEAVLDAVASGQLAMEDAVSTMSAYLTAGMDTTVNAISGVLRLFALQPEIWAMLRQEPSLAGDVFEELLRWESPLVGFFRLTTEDVSIGETTIPAGNRVMLHWAAANRDPRHYPDPHVFDIRRKPLDHLAFGYGTHTCAGQALARLELASLLLAFIPRVESFHLKSEPVRRYNPIVRSWESVPLSVSIS